jgi:chaperonin GroEL
MISNVVNKETLRRVQIETMNSLKDILLKSFGPYGSNSIIYSGKDALPRYTKDGHTILGSIQFNGPIESSVLTDIEEETRTQAMKVGDSTTSVTILSALIFNKLAEYEEQSESTPAEIVRVFKSVTERIKNTIKSHGREATIQDMYDIALISTNGDEDLANELKVIYNNFGLDVYIDVKPSLTGEIKRHLRLRYSPSIFSVKGKW